MKIETKQAILRQRAKTVKQIERQTGRQTDREKGGEIIISGREDDKKS